MPASEKATGQFDDQTLGRGGERVRGGCGCAAQRATVKVNRRDWVSTQGFVGGGGARRVSRTTDQTNTEDRQGWTLNANGGSGPRKQTMRRKQAWQAAAEVLGLRTTREAREAVR